MKKEKSPEMKFGTVHKPFCAKTKNKFIINRILLEKLEKIKSQFQKD